MLRSFASRDRAGKLKKPSKRSFRDDAKLKLIEQLSTPLSPPSAEYVMPVSFFAHVVPQTFFVAYLRTNECHNRSILHFFLCHDMTFLGTFYFPLFSHLRRPHTNSLLTEHHRVCTAQSSRLSLARMKGCSPLTRMSSVTRLSS